jgi:hemolysin III
MEGRESTGGTDVSELDRSIRSARPRSSISTLPPSPVGAALMPGDDRDLEASAVSDALVAPLGTPWRPSWRGRLHLVALVLAVPLVAALAIESTGARSRAAVVVYGTGLCAMLAVSTTYHRWVHTYRARLAWRRADHATIYLMIAGTCTALALTALDTGWTVALLIPVWLAAAVGAAFKAVRFDRAHRLGGALYVVLGWSGLLLVAPVWRYAGLLPVALLVGGGVVYTLGALGFNRRWPTLSPARFSYHEVWHACTIAAAGLHAAAIARLAI